MKPFLALAEIFDATLWEFLLWTHKKKRVAWPNRFGRALSLRWMRVYTNQWNLHSIIKSPTICVCSCCWNRQGSNKSHGLSKWFSASGSSVFFTSPEIDSEFPNLHIYIYIYYYSQWYNDINGMIGSPHFRNPEIIASPRDLASQDCLPQMQLVLGEVLRRIAAELRQRAAPRSASAFRMAKRAKLGIETRGWWVDGDWTCLYMFDCPPMDLKLFIVYGFESCYEWWIEVLNAKWNGV